MLMQIQYIKLEECRKGCAYKEIMSFNKHIRKRTKQSVLALIQRWPHKETNATSYSHPCMIPSPEFRPTLWLTFHQQIAAELNLPDFWAQVMESLIAYTLLSQMASTCSLRTLPSISFSLLTLRQASHYVESSTLLRPQCCEQAQAIYSEETVWREGDVQPAPAAPIIPKTSHQPCESRRYLKWPSQTRLQMTPAPDAICSGTKDPS